MSDSPIDDALLRQLLHNLQASTDSLTEETRELRNTLNALEKQLIPLAASASKVVDLEVRIAELEVDRIRREAVTSTLMKAPNILRGVGGIILVALGYLASKWEQFK